MSERNGVVKTNCTGIFSASDSMNVWKKPMLKTWINQPCGVCGLVRHVCEVRFGIFRPRNGRASGHSFRFTAGWTDATSPYGHLEEGNQYPVLVSLVSSRPICGVAEVGCSFAAPAELTAFWRCRRFSSQSIRTEQDHKPLDVHF